MCLAANKKVFHSSKTSHRKWIDVRRYFVATFRHTNKYRATSGLNHKAGIPNLAGENSNLLLPAILVLLLLLCGLTTNYWHTFVTFDQAILGGITGFMLFWLIDLTHKLITHRNGLGFGDVKLMAALGVWVGITGVPLIMLIASLTAVGYAIVTNHRSHSKTFLHRKLPFGPFLLTGGLVCVLAKPYLPFFIGALTS